MKRKLAFSKRLISIITVLTMMITASGSIGVLAEREYAADVSIMSKIVDFKNAPYSEFGTVLVALEELCGYIGIAVSKEGDMYTMTRAEDSVQIQVGNMYAVVNGVRNDLLVSPVERGGVFYVPVEFFSRCFGIPVSVSNDARSADIKPNVYTINIDEQHAAAVSAQQPDADVLATGTQASDILRDHMDLYPGKSSYVYYMANLSFFEGKTIESASLNMTVVRNEVGPSITAVRTASWTKGQVTWNNQPALCEERTVEFKTTDKGDVKASLDILPLVNAARKEGIDLSMKILGTHRAGAKNELDKHPYTVYGVNTVNAPHIEVAVEETYNFPEKEIADASSADRNRYSELELLRSLGVFTENDEFPLDLKEGVMRYEFIRYVLRLANSQISMGTAQHFSDVPADALFYDEVNTARALGYVAGDSGVEFRPYDFITVGEAITILGRVLNYDVYAEERGGFTPGYFDAARIGDLYLGGATEKTILSFNEMFKLLKNSLDASVLEVVSFKSDGSAEYIFNDSKNILTEFWNATLIEGTVTQNEYSNITPGVGGKEDTITIDSKELKLRYEPYNEFLGYRVKGYYEKENEVLLYIGMKEYNFIEISLSDIESVSETASSVTFSYMKENGNRTQESFLKNATVIYNGKSISSAEVNSELLSADGGSIKLVGNELVIINAYRTVIVYSTDIENTIIYDKNDPYDNVLRMHNKEWRITDVEGKNVELGSLKKNHILSVCESLDGQLINCILSDMTLSGAVSLIENAGTEDVVITVNGSEYRLGNQNPGANWPTGKEYWTEYISLGARGVFYLDSFGNIVNFDSLNTENIPGYVSMIDYAGGSALSKKLQAAVLVKEAEVYELFDLASKVTVDGIKMENSEDILEYFTKTVDVTDESGTVIGTEEIFAEQGVIFDVNSNGEIKEIDTAVYREEEGSKENTLHIRHTKEQSALNYKGGLGKLGDKFYWFADSSLTAVIPSDATSFEDYETYSSDWMNDESPVADVYTIGSLTPEASIVVVYGDKPGAGISASTAFSVVDRLATAYDEDGYEVGKIYYHTDSKTIASAIVKDDEMYLLEGVKRGDIVRIGKDSDGELTTLTKYYDYETKTIDESMCRYDDFNKNPRIYGGYTAYVYGKYIRVTPQDNPTTTDEEKWRWLNSEEFTNFFRYEVNNAGVELFPATLADVRAYDAVPYNPTGLLIHTVYEDIRGNTFLIEMPQPEGTGIYSVTYNPGADSESISGMPVTSGTRYNAGDIITLPTAPSRIDNDFTGWLIDGSVYSPRETYVITGNTTITAQWVYNPTFEFNFVDEEGEVTSIIRNWALTDTDGNSVERTLPGASEFTKEGSKLVGWKLGDETYLPGGAYTPETQGATFTAVWMKAWSGNVSTNAPSIENGVYQITTAEELAWFSKNADASANAILVNDIYLNNFADCGDGKQIDATTSNWFDNENNIAEAKNWYNFAIGRTNAYQGTFDGNGKTIYGLYTTSTASDIGGLFFNITGGTVKNLTLRGAYVLSAVSGGNYDTGRASVIANIVNGGTIEGVTAYGKITAAQDCSANLTGTMAVELQGSAVIKNNISYVNIDLSTGSTTLDTSPTSNQQGVGGIVGAVKSGSGIIINGNKNYGDITAPYTKASAGILAWANADSYFNRNEFAGNVNYGNIVAGTHVHQIVAARKGGLAAENSAFANIINQNTASGSATVFVPTTP